MSLLVAVQLQLPGAVMLTLSAPPSGPIELLVGEIEYVQMMPACDTVNVSPAIVIVPVRGSVLEFQETE